MAITFHELVHVWTAYKLGDNTTTIDGRLSLNLIKHISLFGTIILPIMFILVGTPVFRRAKPVPINPANFKNRLKGEMLVSLSGPAINLLLAILFLFFHIFLSSVVFF